jgi:adenylate cyclase
MGYILPRCRRCAENDMERRLAAVVAIDVVGYSRLMGQDEAGTLAAVGALRRGIIEPAIAARAGRLVKAMGDGFLLEFPSAVEAVECAAEVQQSVSELESQSKMGASHRAAGWHQRRRHHGGGWRRFW